MSASQKLPSSNLVPIRLRVSVPLLAAVDDLARRCGASRSDAVRSLLVGELTRRSEWLPAADGADGGDGGQG